MHCTCIIHYNSYVCPERKKLSKRSYYAVAMTLHDIISVIMTILFLNNLESTYHFQMLKLFPVGIKSKEQCMYHSI